MELVRDYNTPMVRKLLGIAFILLGGLVVYFDRVDWQAPTKYGMVPGEKWIAGMLTGVGLVLILVKKPKSVSSAANAHGEVQSNKAVD